MPLVVEGTPRRDAPVGARHERDSCQAPRPPKEPQPLRLLPLSHYATVATVRILKLSPGGRLFNPYAERKERSERKVLCSLKRVGERLRAPPGLVFALAFTSLAAIQPRG
jgi:hypothetical protein